MKVLSNGFLLSCIFFLGCDVPGFLIVENRKDIDVSFSIHYSVPEGADSIHLQIPSNQSQGVIMGFGTKWNKTGKIYFSDQVEELVIASSKDTIRIDSQYDILNFVERGNTNFNRRKLLLTIE